MKSRITKLHYKKYINFLDFLILVILLPYAIVYYIAVQTRILLYKIKILKRYRPKAYTISVGNMTTGGVGKTPIVKEIAEYLSNQGEKVAILSRGYGGTLSNKDVNVISDGKKIYYSPEEAGDEPYWLAANCPKCAVLTSANRVAIAKYAVEKLGCTKLILDDGYQHLKLMRDLNILVVDYEKRFGNHMLLPAGPLREPRMGIRRADKIIVVNKTDNVIEAKSYCKKLQKKYRKPVFLANMEFESIYSLASSLKITKTKCLLAFCAIAQPLQFYNQLLENNHEIVYTKTYNDHYRYTLDDLDELEAIAEENNIDNLITTEKDAVKIKEMLNEKQTNLKTDILVVKLATNVDLEGLLNEST